ncbi:MAG: isoaspartyl peptidase/L-asparaginase [Opitutaceae bacterium]|nr:isoaspartyl peptidase/L-asparaginase [Opitutaceae bacterium]
MADSTFGLVVHGGAGVILRQDLTLELEAEYHTQLEASLAAGYGVLEHGGASLEAVVAAIKVMEDSPLFNAGHGAVMNAEGVCELDASIMDGLTLDAGAVAGLQHIRNPIALARDVLERTPHVMLIGDGAEAFARQVGYEFVPNEYFQTERRRRQLALARELEAKPGGHRPAGRKERVTFATVDDNKFGTVGCAALDRKGNLAAGTSTGGMTNKQYGRVGDSPIIGAGTYARNATCALSATGHGEFFIRSVLGHNVSALMEYKGLPLAEAAGEALRQLEELGGTGGLVAIDRLGHVAMPFNTPGMYRGCRVAGQAPVVEIFGAEYRAQTIRS